MPELVVDAPETLLDLPKTARSKAKTAKTEKRKAAIDGYKEDKFCVLTGYVCKRGDCRTCHYPDGHDDSRARELEQAYIEASKIIDELRAKIKEQEAKEKVYAFMDAHFAKAYEEKMKQQQPLEAVTNGTPS